MATGSKILRRNFALKIGSSKEMRVGLHKKQQATSFARSTSEMVKSYINGTYKSDSANSFWNELTHVKVASPREENKGPLRSMRSVLNPQQPSIIPVTSAGGFSSLASDSKRATLKPNTTQILFGDGTNKARQASAVAAIAANRRLLRNSNGCYKIISNRRFGSSASSSCGSIFKRHDDRRRVSSFKRTVNGGFIERLYNTQPSCEIKTSLANLSSSKYLMSLRNQNIPAPLGSVAEAVKVSSNIQQELMPIDKTIRERISLKNTFGKSASPEPSNTDPMSGWHHPPSPEKLSTGSRLSDRLWYPREPTASNNQPIIAQAPAIPTATTKADRNQSTNRSIERFTERRMNSSIKLSDKETQENSRLRVARKPARLTLSCTPPPSTTDNIAAPLNATSLTTSKRKMPPTQSASPISACSSNTLSSDDESQQRKMIHMTARRISAVEHQPVRRFSLRRPPKADVPQITPPAPGPAAESINLQNNRSGHSLNTRSSAMSAFADNVVSNSNPTRYRHFNSRPY